jgi:benzodiazapine receptor
MMKKDVTRQIVVVIAVLATIAINGLANALPLNGLNTGEISDRFQVYFVPAGYVFSIWGLIYLGLLAYAVYQALPAQKENPRMQTTGWLFVLSSVANIAWIFLWHYEVFTLTIFAMLALLVCLILIYLHLGIGRSEVSSSEKWFVRVPFSIYLGWITVATIANATSLLDYLNWGGWGLSGQLWAVIMLLIGAGVATAVYITRRDFAYMLVILWAFAGIAAKHEDTALVANAAWVSFGIVGGVLLVGSILFYTIGQRRVLRGQVEKHQ